MTTGELIKRARVYLNDVDARRFSNDLLRESANASLVTLLAKIKRRNPTWFQKSAALATVATSNTVVLPTDYAQPVRLEYTSDRVPLRAWRWPEWPLLTGTGKPWEYRIDKGFLVFRQAADAIHDLTFWYEPKLTRLTTDSETHILPDFFDEVLVARSARRLGAAIDTVLLDEDEAEALNEITNSQSQIVGYRQTRTQR